MLNICDDKINEIERDDKETERYKEIKDLERETRIKSNFFFTTVLNEDSYGHSRPAGSFLKCGETLTLKKSSSQSKESQCEARAKTGHQNKENSNVRNILHTFEVGSPTLSHKNL